MIKSHNYLQPEYDLIFGYVNWTTHLRCVVGARPGARGFEPRTHRMSLRVPRGSQPCNGYPTARPGARRCTGCLSAWTAAPSREFNGYPAARPVVVQLSQVLHPVLFSESVGMFFICMAHVHPIFNHRYPCVWTELTIVVHV